MPTSRQTLPTTLRETPAFKVNCVRCEEPAFVSPSGAFSRAKIRVSPSFLESTWAKWALWKAQRELPFDDWQPQVLCLCDTMGHYKSPSFLLLQNNSERKEKRWCMMRRRGGFQRKKGGLAFETGPAQMYMAGGLGCGCWWRSPGSLSIVALCGSQQPRDGKLPVGVPTVLNVRPTMVEQPPKPHRPPTPSSPTATPHTDDVIGELMSPDLTSNSVSLCVDISTTLWD